MKGDQARFKQDLGKMKEVCLNIADQKLDKTMKKEATEATDPNSYLARVTMCKIKADEKTA